MRLTQGQFSYLPDLTDEQIEKQIAYALSNGWSIMVEYTDDPHPRNSLWEMWAQPMFDLGEDDAEVVMRDVNACRSVHANKYVKVVAYDRSLGRQTSAMSFIVNRPAVEPGFRLDRQEAHDRVIRYTLTSYAGRDTPQGQRYGGDSEPGTIGDNAASWNGKSNGKAKD